MYIIQTRQQAECSAVVVTVRFRKSRPAVGAAAQTRSRAGGVVIYFFFFLKLFYATGRSSRAISGGSFAGTQRCNGVGGGGISRPMGTRFARRRFTIIFRANRRAPPSRRASASSTLASGGGPSARAAWRWSSPNRVVGPCIRYTPNFRLRRLDGGGGTRRVRFRK